MFVQVVILFRLFCTDRHSRKVSRIPLRNKTGRLPRQKVISKKHVAYIISKMLSLWFLVNSLVLVPAGLLTSDLLVKNSVEEHLILGYRLIHKSFSMGKLFCTLQTKGVFCENISSLQMLSHGKCSSRYQSTCNASCIAISRLLTNLYLQQKISV